MRGELLHILLRCVNDVETSLVYHVGNARRITAYIADMLDNIYDGTMTEEQAREALARMLKSRWDEEQLDAYFSDLPEKIRPRD